MKLLETVRHYDALQYESFDNDVTGRVRNGTAIPHGWMVKAFFACGMNWGPTVMRLEYPLKISGEAIC